MIPRDEYDRRVGQRLAKPLKLAEGKDYGRVGRADRVEEIAGNDDGIGRRGDDSVYGGAEGVGNIGFALIDAGRSLPVILPHAEMRIGDMSQFHGWRMDLDALKSKHTSA